jgi:acid phosphatase (class A)
LFKQAAADTKFFSDRAKDHFRRARPTTRPDFTPRSRESSNGYPSGHSTRGTVWAELLAEMYPEQRAALLARGREIGYHRMIEGVHFPSDVYAGRVVGHAVARQLLANVTFRAEMDQVKAEMDEARAKAKSVAAPATQSASR